VCSVEYGAALIVEFRHAQCQAARGAMIGIFQIEHDFCVMIFAAHAMVGVPGTSAHLSAE
jgi:hypothetical protein